MHLQLFSITMGEDQEVLIGKKGVSSRELESRRLHLGYEALLGYSVAVRWADGEDLTSLAGSPVRFRFVVTNGRLFSFWVSSDASGASRGYVAAGGPGFTANTDTTGSQAYAFVR